MLADYLVVDLTKPYVEQGSYLEIELAALRGDAHETCGGRTLNDDVVDTMFTQLINAGPDPSSATASIGRPGPERARSRTWRSPTRIRPRRSVTDAMAGLQP